MKNIENTGKNDDFNPKFHRELGISDFEYSEIIKRLKRVPNLLETYLFSAMWSEHCGYKHSKKYLSKLPSKGGVFRGENSGGIMLKDHIIFFKTESHNHPSAVEPYQGAATGIGGILRDILAMNARPIALLNSLKFGDIEGRYASGPIFPSAKRNKYLLNGVVEGISDYGNSTGVPTIGGEVSFESCFNLSPIVNVMAVGLSRKDKVKTSAAKPNLNIVLIGSRTGRDGLFGAAFASKELENGFEDRLSVQIGDPYAKKNLIEATLEILKSKNVSAAQDLGAAGLLSSTSEMAAKGGVTIDLYLEKVPLREKNMAPFEIMLSESQERMVFVANDRGVKEIFEICKKYEINAAVIGKTFRSKSGQNMYNLYNNGVLEGSVPVCALTEPVLYDLKPKKPDYIDILAGKKLLIPKSLNTPENIKHLIFKMAASPEFSSKKYIFRQYDSTVGARTLKSSHSIGVAPLNIFETGDVIGFSMDSNERASYLDPYQGAFNLIFEGYRNAVSSGFEPLGITNCLNFANPESRGVAFQFLKTIDGMKDALEILGLPVVSGNVSFYNEGASKDSCECANLSNDVVSPDLKIYPSPVVGFLSVLKAKSPIYSITSPDEAIFLIGKQAGRFQTAASLYQKIFFNFIGGTVDRVDIQLEKKLHDTVFKLSKNGWIQGAIDVSKGGTMGSLMIMLFNSLQDARFDDAVSSKIGFSGAFAPDIDALFGEITGRYLISTCSEGSVEKYLIKKSIPFKKLGKTNRTGFLDLGFTKINLAELWEIYENSLERKAN